MPSPTGGTAAASASAAAGAPSTATRSALIAQLEITYADGTVETVAHGASGARADWPSCRRACTTARRTTPASPTGWAPGLRRRRWLAVRALARSPPRSSPRPARRCVASRRCGRRGPSRTPTGAAIARLRPEPRRPAAHPGARRGAAGRSRCATPRCSRTASSASGRCARAAATDRYTLRGGGAEDVGAALHLPRLPLRRGRRLAGRARPGRRRRRRLPHRHASAPGWFDVLQPAAQPAARERRLGHARQLRRRADRLPAARRAPRLDRRHPGVRADGGFLYDCAGFLASWLRDLAAEQRRSRHRARRTCPGCQLIVPRAARRGVGGRRGHRARGCSTSASATSRCSRAQYDSMRAWVEQIAALAGDGHVWTGGVPVRRLARSRCSARRARRGPDRQGAGGDRLPRLHRAARRPRRRRARPRTTRAPYDELAAGSARRSTTSSSRRPAGWRATPRRRTRSPCVSTCCRAEQHGRAGARLAELVRARRLPHRHRLRRHAARLRRPGRRRLSSTTAYHLLLQTACPSWLYPVTMGATTIWERWDSLLPDGTINPRRDDLVQPLRARRGRRLPAPRGRRARRRRRPATGSCTSPPAPGGGLTHAAAGAADTVRGRQRAVAAARRSARRRCRRAHRQHGSGRVARPTRRRGRSGVAPLRMPTPPGRPRPVAAGARRTRCSASSTSVGPPAPARRRDSPAVTAS